MGLDVFYKQVIDSKIRIFVKVIFISDIEIKLLLENESLLDLKKSLAVEKLGEKTFWNYSYFNRLI